MPRSKEDNTANSVALFSSIITLIIGELYQISHSESKRIAKKMQQHIFHTTTNLSFCSVSFPWDRHGIRNFGLLL